jgi:hypothetical protein
VEAATLRSRLDEMTAAAQAAAQRHGTEHEASRAL